LSLIKAMEADIEVIMLTSISDVKVAVSALRIGACDYVQKPFKGEELLITISRALERRRLSIENRNYRKSLEHKVRERTRHLDQANRRLKDFSIEIINTLVSTIEAKDKYTEGHSKRVAEWAKKLAQTVGLPAEVFEDIYLAGLLHDIGKVGIPNHVLNKPGPLTREEVTLFHEHPLIAQKILSNSTFISRIIPYIRSHHEAMDGSGYPDGLRGWEIKLAARILAIADSFDAMTSVRAYRPAKSFEEALAEMRRCARTQFDEQLVECFEAIVRGLPLKLSRNLVN
jgi:putative nucleotidyltransferase with HDIG domain